MQGKALKQMAIDAIIKKVKNGEIPMTNTMNGTEAIIQNWLPPNVQVLHTKRPAHLLDLAPTDLHELPGISWDQHSLKTAWEGVTRGITAEESSAALRWWHGLPKVYHHRQQQCPES